MTQRTAAVPWDSRLKGRRAGHDGAGHDGAGRQADGDVVPTSRGILAQESNG